VDLVRLDLDDADVADFVAAMVFLPASTAGAAGSRHRSS
jgi:hypothetical protein